MKKAPFTPVIPLLAVSCLLIWTGCEKDDDNGGHTIVSNPGAGMTDNDGIDNRTIVLGNGQEWMAENLGSAHYRNGDIIQNVMGYSEWGNFASGAWAHYSNNADHDLIYGKLYNWYAVEDPRQLCPLGWHVPTHDDWTELITYLDLEALESDHGTQSITAGGMMKSAGTAHWTTSYVTDTDPIGFSALPGGARHPNTGGFDGMGNTADWWSSTADDNVAFYCQVTAFDARVNTGRFNKRMGASVRCIKD